MIPILVLTCEHASHAVPPGFEAVFSNARDQLLSHRGWDPGALSVYNKLTEKLTPFFAASGCYTRLAVELNRSPGHPRLFSDLTRVLPAAQRDFLFDSIWRPFRDATASAVENALQIPDAVVWHLSVHSFVDELDGDVRPCEVGLLYDPRRSSEKALAQLWRSRLQALRPDWRVRMNFPYRGVADGHTTALRRRFGSRYLGLEIELRQGLLAMLPPDEVAHALADSLPLRG